MTLTHLRPWDPRALRESAWMWPLWTLGLTFDAQPSFPDPDTLSALYARRIHALGLSPLPFATLRFHPAPPKKARRRRREPVRLSALYEGQIVEALRVPTRLDDWHDFFNALAFILFPRAKWALHQRQYRLLQARIGAGAARLPGARTREQDALSLFDEGGVVVITEPRHRAALEAEPDDLQALLQPLAQRGQARLVPFGHALYEHLVEGLPCPLATPHFITLEHPQRSPQPCLDQLDFALAGALEDARLFQRPHRARGLALSDLDPSAGPRSERPCSAPMGRVG